VVQNPTIADHVLQRSILYDSWALYQSLSRKRPYLNIIIAISVI